MGLVANSEHYSRVTVLLCKCENLAPVVYPAAGQGRGRGLPNGHQQRRKTGSGGSADGFPKYPSLQERKSGLLYLCSLVSDGGGERPEVPPAMTEI